MHEVTTLLARVATAAIERKRLEAAMTSRFAPRFNAVELLAPGETRLSEIFRWLLDETETHGQGSIFRDRFIDELLGEIPEVWVGASVKCEVSTADGFGRIDLLIVNREGTRSIVIENKPWAGWQVNQLARYLADQGARRTETRVHALIGGNDTIGALEQHWFDCKREPLPDAVRASGFGEVAAWLEGCATAARADNVRNFLYDLADYCRRYILGQPDMTDINETADLLLKSDESLMAAREIAAAVPLAMTRDVARRLNGSVQLFNKLPAVRVTHDRIALDFVLFGNVTPWAGVTDKALVSQLRGAVAWALPEKRWPRWCYISKVSGQGAALVKAAAEGDTELVANLIPLVAKALIGTESID